MKRIQFFEFGDQAWLPGAFRRGITEFLAAVSRWTRLYEPTAAVLADVLEATGEKRVVALGAGSGGGILDISPRLPTDAQLTLTDLVPDKTIRLAEPRAHYHAEPVNALNVPSSLPGVRVMYAAMHHLRPDQVKTLFENCVENKQAIMIVEGTERTFVAVVGSLVFVPLAVLILTPFVKPFSFIRCFWTYVIPVFPLIAVFDGIVSCLRTYDENDLRKLTSGLVAFDWKFQIAKGPFGQRVSVFTGRPPIQNK